MRRWQRICVFCGSSHGRTHRYADEARRTAHALRHAGLELVYGGGSIGLMGVLADEMLALGGKVTGVIPYGLASKEIVHQGLTHLELTPSMHARKAAMAELSDGFLALPGGFGTFEELFEAITWSQLGIHAKPIGLLDVDGFFEPLLKLVDHAIDEQFIPAAQRGLLVVGTDPAELLAQMHDWSPPSVRRWLSAPDL